MSFETLLGNERLKKNLIESLSKKHIMLMGEINAFGAFPKTQR